MSATSRGAEREELDGYWTPLPCATAICARLLADDVVERGGAILEPSVGNGAFAAAIDATFEPEVLVGVDLKRQESLDALKLDFVEGDFLAYEPTEYFDAVIGNPPFGDAERHVRHALQMIDPDVGALAFLLRLNFLEGKKRVAGFWREHSPSLIYVLNRRPSFKKTKKPMIDKKTGEVVLNKRTGKPRSVSSSNDATAYGVFVWSRRMREGRGDPLVRWIEW